MVTENNKEEIKFGIMCNGTVFSAWQADAIKSLLELDIVKCELLIIDDNGPQQKSGKKKLRHILWYPYNRISKMWSRSFKKIDLSNQLDAVPLLKCQTGKQDKYSQYFKDSDINTIKESDLHFILRFGFGIIRGEILNAARYGIWSFHHDDEQKYRGGPPCFWEIYKDDKVTGAMLQRLTDKLDAGVVLKKGYVKTKYSYSKNRDQIYKESSRWPVLLCVNILNGHTEFFESNSSETFAPIYHTPRNWQLVVYFLKLVYYNLREACQKVFYTDCWNIGVVRAPISAFLGDNKPAAEWFPLRSKNRFLADPFCLVDENNKEQLHIFYEAYPFREVKGRIDYVLFNNGFGSEHKLIDEQFHLSYPYVLRYNDEQYLIPESGEANRVFMYRAAEFPLLWEKSHILIDGFAGIDNTIIEHENTYWLFATDKKDGLHFNLKIFYSGNLFDEWKPHPQNPVKTDIRSVRPAGTPFLYKGDWYRPSMDYAEKIEGRIVINKVLKLSKTEFEEVAVKTIDPYTDSPFSDKIHTLCDAGDYTIVDGGKEAFIFSSIFLIIHKLKLALKKAKVKLK